jgi:hypothetical protein
MRPATGVAQAEIIPIGIDMAKKNDGELIGTTFIESRRQIVTRQCSRGQYNTSSYIIMSALRG